MELNCTEIHSEITKIHEIPSVVILVKTKYKANACLADIKYFNEYIYFKVEKGFKNLPSYLIT